MIKAKNQTTIDETTSMYDNLEDFGLSSYEARVFYTMLKLGFSSARKISNESGVPFGRIYDVLGSLEDKDLIEKQDSRPKRYALREPKFALNNLLIRKKKDLDSLTNRANAMEEHLAKLYKRKPEEGLFWSVAIEPESITRHLGRLTETEEELLIYVDAQINVVKGSSTEEAVRDFLDTLCALVEKGVKIKILLGGVTDMSQLDRITMMLVDYPTLSQIPFRVSSLVTNSFDIIDREKVLLKINNPVNPSEYFAAIYVWQKKFAEELREKYNQMWEEAQENR
jgi:sugar-specific transcriptional regulator TrmB